MKKYFYTISLLLMIHHISFSQSPSQIDSLWKHTLSIKSDSLKALEVCKMANLFFDIGDKTSMEKAIAVARDLFETVKPVSAEVELYRLLADVYGDAGDVAKRHLYNDSIIEVSKKAGYVLGEGMGYMGKAMAVSRNWIFGKYL
jgi:hypothetical protein